MPFVRLHAYFQLIWSNLMERKMNFSCSGMWWDDAKAQITFFCQQFAHLSLLHANRERILKQE